PFLCFSNTSQETITQLLCSIGTKRKVERYLCIFSLSANPSQPAKFVGIKVDGAVLGQALLCRPLSCHPSWRRAPA
ncbi:hypothetical protein B0F90DRAFT_1844055, partial [Multifurca ochricompacta]